jgi:hypothetical protein
MMLAAGLFVAGGAQGQKMYRCGSIYQDRPCDVAQESKNTGRAAAAPNAQAKAAADAQCTQLGADSQQVVWAREAGKSQASLLAAANTPEQQRLVRDAYHKRGSSVEVRAAIEADCMADKQRSAASASSPAR